MKKTDLERYFKLFTNQEAEDFFDSALREQHIKFVKRDIPDSKFSEYFFHKNDIFLVEIINEKLKEVESEETNRLTSKKHNKPYAIELLLMLVLIGIIIVIILRL
ncbi:hypothetical protein [Kordia jejudonensis]|uniref:hypothetical protein n=1 Tax=Kordia jejudonensis TaxID=1348245 RepID=UPI00062988BB|nr:hypothetical protein [Kordia jejudonensis]